MEILQQITELKKTVEETEQLFEELLSFLEAQKLRSENKDLKIAKLKETVMHNIKKIDKILGDNDANT